MHRAANSQSNRDRIWMICDGANEMSHFLLDIFADRGWGLYHHLIFLSSSNTTAWSLLLHLLDPGQGLCIVEPNNLIACILLTCWGDRASLWERMSSWVRI